MATRRRVLAAAAGVTGFAAAGILPALARAAGAEDLDELDLIYLSPIKSDGNLSRCQAEVWFVHEGDNLFVVTDANAWRARAVTAGLQKARVWVMDVGQWQKSDGAYKTLPSHVTNVSLQDDKAVHARVLDRFGDKYSLEWVLWGPRFRNGLADGSRVLLKYQPA